jgi:hypothetical protein
VQLLDVTEAGTWQFRDSTLHWTHKAAGSTFDPFPAYPHDLETAQGVADYATQILPPLYDVEVYLPNREETGRTNGYSSNAYVREYADGECVDKTPLGLIVLSGKRIPPHPAVTRYLVGHEYGHHVCWMLGSVRGASHLQDDSYLSQYAEARGLDPDRVRHDGAGGTWHDSISEIFACDFRILILGIESEYWPHPGIAHPDTVDGLADWWAAAYNVLRAADPIA